MGKANCRRTKALILYLINTPNEILISIRHGTILSTLLGFSQEENALLKGMLKLCVQRCDAWQVSHLQSSCKSPCHCSRVILRWQEKRLLCSCCRFPLVFWCRLLIFCSFFPLIYDWPVLGKRIHDPSSTHNNQQHLSIIICICVKKRLTVWKEKNCEFTLRNTQASTVHSKI